MGMCVQVHTEQVVKAQLMVMVTAAGHFKFQFTYTNLLQQKQFAWALRTSCRTAQFIVVALLHGTRSFARTICYIFISLKLQIFAFYHFGKENMNFCVQLFCERRRRRFRTMKTGILCAFASRQSEKAISNIFTSKSSWNDDDDENKTRTNKRIQQHFTAAQREAQNDVCPSSSMTATVTTEHIQFQ